MDINDINGLGGDADGLATYEYLANNIDEISSSDAKDLAGNIIKADANGQYTASAARFLHAVGPEKYYDAVDMLLAAVVEKDRARAYLPDLLGSIYGKDYLDRIDVLMRDADFRRIYKRVYPTIDTM